MNDRDEMRLRHILDAAREAQEFAVGHEIEDLRRDRRFFREIGKLLPDIP